MGDKEYIIIGSFVVGNLGTIFGIVKWYIKREVDLATRITRMEKDIDGIALALGTKRALGQASGKNGDESEGPFQT